MAHTKRVISGAVDRLLGLAQHVRVLPARPAVHQQFPLWLPHSVSEGLGALGIDSLWSHQIRALDELQQKRSVVLATGTGSGKSLVYQVDALRRIHTNPRTTVIYLAPTKALGHDQARAFEWTGLRVGVLDGDTPPEERQWIAAHAQVVITNPDMLSVSVLPRHHRWRRVLRHLELVVVDECHVYRGVFGSHTALIMRRLLRTARLAGAEPAIVAASATVADPDLAIHRLTGEHVVAITTDGSPRGQVQVVMLAPPTQPGVGLFGQSAQVLAELVEAEKRCLLFIPSRIGAERLAEQVRELIDPGLANSVTAYRAGLLAEERRAIESQLRSGELRAVTSTNALELGMDISGLDAVVVAGWPGRRAAFRQQIGRTGRAGAEGLAVLVADSDPLDRFLVNHPEQVFDTPAEAGVIDPDNPLILRQHLVAAAAESALSDDDLVRFGSNAGSVVEELVAEGVLRRRPTGVFWPTPEPPTAVSNIRGIDAPPVQIVEARTGRLLGNVDAAGAPTTVFPGAVYVHLGTYYDVIKWDIDESVAFVVDGVGEFVTSALSESAIDIDEVCQSRPLGVGQLSEGRVTHTSRVHGYHRRRRETGEVLSTHPLDLPERTLSTRACWWTLPNEALDECGITDIAGAAHAAEHAAIGLLPLYATCDRWDIGGVSTVHHPATGTCTVFVYDGHPGGIGFAAAGYTAAEQWLAATLATIEACPCADGCPGCVQSPKCGNGNEPLSKSDAAKLLRLLVGN